jgi:hypothetical protein
MFVNEVCAVGVLISDGFAAQVPAGATASASGKAVNGRSSLKVSCGPSTSKSYSTAMPRTTFHHVPSRTFVSPRLVHRPRMCTSAALKAANSGRAVRLATL